MELYQTATLNIMSSPIHWQGKCWTQTDMYSRWEKIGRKLICLLGKITERSYINHYVFRGTGLISNME